MFKVFKEVSIAEVQKEVLSLQPGRVYIIDDVGLCLLLLVEGEHPSSVT